MTADITFHFPPELFNLLVDTIPLLNRSKKDVLTFFRGAGVPDEITGDLGKKLKATPLEINKYEIVRTVLEALTLAAKQCSGSAVRSFDGWSRSPILTRAGLWTNSEQKA